MRSKSSEVQLGQRRQQHDARGVHHDVDTAELRFDLVEHRGDLRFVGDVRGHHHGAAAGVLDLVGGHLGPVAVTCIMHGDRDAGLPQADSHAMADASRRSGDDRYSFCHACPPDVAVRLQRLIAQSADSFPSRL